jgi:hypothetical protein
MRCEYEVPRDDSVAAVFTASGDDIQLAGGLFLVNIR